MSKDRGIKDLMRELQERRQSNTIYPNTAIKEKPIKAVTVAELADIILQDLKKSINNYDATNEHISAIEAFLEQQTRNKGVMLQGNFGSGKTELLRAFSRLSQKVQNIKTFQMISAHDIVSGYEINGDIFLNSLNKRSIAIDDFGSEKVSFRYQKEDLLIRFVESRYNLRASHNTHISTNLSSSEIEQRYGGRVASRMHELVKCVIVGGSANSKDYRY